MRAVRRCHSYLPGHQTHHIAALRVHAKTPRDSVTVLDVDVEGWITFRQPGKALLRWWHHDASRLAALWRAKAHFARVRGSQFLVAELNEEGAYWQYCDDASSPCLSRPSTDLMEAIRSEGGFLVALTPRKKKATLGPGSPRLGVKARPG